MKKTLVSVIIPCFNAEATLAKSLDSVTRQTLSDIEILCVDDGSEDDTPQILNEYASMDSRIRVVTHATNLGLAAARNTGLNACIAEYVAGVDADDTMEEEMLEYMYKDITDNHSDISVCGFSESADNKVAITRIFNSSCVEVDAKTDIFAVCNPAFWNKLWKKSLYHANKIRFPSGLLYEDLATTPRVISKAAKITFVAKSLYNYTNNIGSITKRYGAKEMCDYFSVFDILRDYFIERLRNDELFRSYFASMVNGNILYHINTVQSLPDAERAPWSYCKTLALAALEYIRALEDSCLKWKPETGEIDWNNLRDISILSSQPCTIFPRNYQSDGSRLSTLSRTKPTVSVVLTSCSRHDLLDQTLESFLKMNTYPISQFIIVEDGEYVPADLASKYQSEGIEWISTGKRVGQIAAIDYAYSRVKHPYIFHLEDDWHFYREAFIEPSIEVLQYDFRCLQVWIRSTADTNGHPISDESCSTNGVQWKRMKYDYLGVYHGFSFNPGLRRLSDYVAIDGYGIWSHKAKEKGLHYEEMIGIEYRRRDYYAAILDVPNGYVRHLGEGRHVPRHDTNVP